MKPLSQKDLDSYQLLLDDPDCSNSQMFNGLNKLYQSYFEDLQTLAMVEPNIEFLPLAEEAEAQQKKWEDEHIDYESAMTKIDEKSALIANTDSSTMALPELNEHIKAQQQFDLELKEALERTKVHLDRGEKVKRRNIEIIGQIEKIMINAKRNIEIEENKFLRMLARNFWFAKFKSRAFTLLPAFGFSVLLDWLSQSSEASALANNEIAAIFHNHYTFLVVFFIIELFLVDGIKDKIAHYFAKKYCSKSFAYISSLFPDISAKMMETKSKYGVNPNNLMARLIAIGSRPD